MNVLPMVVMFLWVFGVFSLTFIREGREFFFLETLILRHHRTERAVNNALVKRTYDKTKQSKRGKGNPEKRKKYRSNREIFPPLDVSKFNLAPLLEHIGDQKEHPLYQSLAQLLYLLYQERLFSKLAPLQKVEYKVLDFLIEQKDSLKNGEDFASMVPGDPQLAEIYYRMLKGTSCYNDSEGYPPLQDYVWLGKQASAVSLPLASPRLLEALFGKEIKNKILAEEKRRWKEGEKRVYVSKDQVKEWLSRDLHRAFSFSQLEAYLDSSARLTTKGAMVGQDRGTGIVVRKKI